MTLGKRDLLHNISTFDTLCMWNSMFFNGKKVCKVFFFKRYPVNHMQFVKNPWEFILASTKGLHCQIFSRPIPVAGDLNRWRGATFKRASTKKIVEKSPLVTSSRTCFKNCVGERHWTALISNWPPSQEQQVTTFRRVTNKLPEIQQLALKKWWLGDDPFLLGPGLFLGANC